MLKSFGPYSKSVTAVIGQALTFASLYYGTNHWVSAAVAVASALGVYAVPNAGANTPKDPALPPLDPPTGM